MINPDYRGKVAQILHDYKAKKVQDVEVKIKIILKDRRGRCERDNKRMVESHSLKIN